MSKEDMKMLATIPKIHKLLSETLKWIPSGPGDASTLGTDTFRNG